MKNITDIIGPQDLISEMVDKPYGFVVADRLFWPVCRAFYQITRHIKAYPGLSWSAHLGQLGDAEKQEFK